MFYVPLFACDHHSLNFAEVRQRTGRRQPCAHVVKAGRLSPTGMTVHSDDSSRSAPSLAVYIRHYHTLLSCGCAVCCSCVCKDHRNAVAAPNAAKQRSRWLFDGIRAILSWSHLGLCEHRPLQVAGTARTAVWACSGAWQRACRTTQLVLFFSLHRPVLAGSCRRGGLLGSGTSHSLQRPGGAGWVASAAAPAPSRRPPPQAPRQLGFAQPVRDVRQPLRLPGFVQRPQVMPLDLSQRKAVLGEARPPLQPPRVCSDSVLCCAVLCMTQAVPFSQASWCSAPRAHELT